MIFFDFPLKPFFYIVDNFYWIGFENNTNAELNAQKYENVDFTKSIICDVYAQVINMNMIYDSKYKYSHNKYL